MSGCTYRGQMTRDALELEFQAAVKCDHGVVMGPKLKSSGRTVPTLTCHTISPVPSRKIF